MNIESQVEMLYFEMNLPQSYIEIGEIEKAQTISRHFINSIMVRWHNNSDLIDWNWRLVLLAFFNSIINQNEEALNYMDKAIEMGWLDPWPFSEQFFDNLRDHPRFQELITKQKKRKEEVMALVATYNFPEPEDL